MKRSKVNPTRDQRYFNSTAKKTKDINLSVGHMRGGIRL